MSQTHVTQQEITPILATESTTSRTLQDRFADVVNVKDFGAVGDGVTDDTVAINLAITAITSSGGGVIKFSVGKYLVSSTININSSGIYLIGDAETVSYIVNGSSNTPAISFGTGSTLQYCGGVSKMGFTCKTGVIGVVGQTGISVNYCGQMRFEDIRVDLTGSTSYGSALYTGIHFLSASQSTFSKINVQGCLLNGIQFKDCSDIYMTTCRSDANEAAGYYFNGCQGMQATGCTSYGNNHGWYLVSDNPNYATCNKNNFFISCISDTSKNINWLITDSRDSTFTSCWGSTQKNPSVNTYSSGFYIGTQYCAGLVFTNCTAIYNNAHGVYLDITSSSPSNITFTNCIFGSDGHGNGQSGAGSGLSISGGSNIITGIQIIGGIFIDNATAAITNDSIGNVQIIGNPVGYIGSTDVIPSDGSVTPNKLSAGHPTWLSNGNLGIGTITPISPLTNDTGRTAFGKDGAGYHWFKSTDNNGETAPNSGIAYGFKSNGNTIVSHQWHLSGFDVMIVDNEGIQVNVKSTGSTTARAIQHRFMDVVNVRDFGASGNGITDDTAAIQAALTYCANTYSYGTKLFFPSGSYNISATVNVTSKLSIEGTTGTKIYTSLISGDIFYVTSYEVSFSDIAFQSIPIKTLGFFINFNTSGMCRVQNCQFINGYDGVGFTGTTTGWNRIYNSFFNNNSHCGINIQSHVGMQGDPDFVVSDVCIFGSNPTSQTYFGILLESAGDVTLRHVQTIWCNNGLTINPASDTRAQCVFVSDCLFDSGAGWGIYCYPNGGLIHLLSVNQTWVATNREGGIELGGTGNLILTKFIALIMVSIQMLTEQII